MNREQIANIISKLNPSKTFAIERIDGNTVHASAWRFSVTRAGNLIFYSWLCRREAAFKEGTWVRVMRGVGPDDLRGIEL